MPAENALHKLVLGTVQFGLDYGINNFKGKPAKEKSLEALDFAYKKGIHVFDTAYAYGDGEELLGEFAESRGLTDKLKIITKLKPNIIEESTGKPYDIISENLKESLKRMKRNSVDGYLFHTPVYIRNKTLVEVFVKLKKEGLVKHIGVSIYEPEDALYAANLKEVDYIQVPYNIFDQRLDKTDFFQLAKKNNIKVFARSAFLQGLFFMAEDKIPPNLAGAKAHLGEFDAIIQKYGLSRQEAAFLFSLDHEGIDYVVFGVDDMTHLKENIAIAKKEIDFASCRKELQQAFVSIDKNIIMPSLWKK